MRLLLRAAIVAAFGLLIAVPARAQTPSGSPCLGYKNQVVPFQFEQITVGASAIGFTAATYQPASGNTAATVAIATVETNSVRYRVDGVAAPTSAVGHQATAGATITVCGFTAIKNFQAIQVSAGATLFVTYYRGQSQ